MNTTNLTKEKLVDLYAKMMAAGMLPEAAQEVAPRTREESSSDWYWKNGKLGANTNTKEKHSK